MTQSAMTDPLTDKLRVFVQKENIQPDPNYVAYESGVYAVVDCVFSAQVRYVPVVVPLIARLEERLPDTPELKLTKFIDNVKQIDSIIQNSSEKYAKEVLTKHKLARRLKVDVALDVANFLVARGFDTKADLHAEYPVKNVKKIGPEAERLERLILEDMPPKIVGIGPVLSSYLLILMGYENYVKSDSQLTKLMNDLSIVQLSANKASDREIVLNAIRTIADEMGTTAARLDNALWKYESIGRKPLPWLKEAENKD